MERENYYYITQKVEKITQNKDGQYKKKMQIKVQMIDINNKIQNEFFMSEKDYKISKFKVGIGSYKELPKQNWINKISSTTKTAKGQILPACYLATSLGLFSKYGIPFAKKYLPQIAKNLFLWTKSYLPAIENKGNILFSGGIIIGSSVKILSFIPSDLLPNINSNINLIKGTYCNTINKYFPKYNKDIFKNLVYIDKSSIELKNKEENKTVVVIAKEENKEENTVIKKNVITIKTEDKKENKEINTKIKENIISKQHSIDKHNSSSHVNQLFNKKENHNSIHKGM